MQDNKSGKIQIIVADKGFVFVGLVFDCDNGWVNISRCMNLRQWGTTKGLGVNFETVRPTRLSPILGVWSRPNPLFELIAPRVPGKITSSRVKPFFRG